MHEPRVPSYCSPARYETFLQTGTCFARDELEEIADRYSRAHNRESILAESMKTAKLVTALSDRLGRESWRWPDAVDVKSLQQRALRPARPCAWNRDDRTWLYSTDIHKVMKQYEDLHPEFAFLGVFASDDFARLPNGSCASGGSTCAFSARDLRARGKTRFGLVFNLDRHDQSGSHWVACYCGMDEKALNYGVHYYDSVGRPPLPHIAEFMDRVVADLGSPEGFGISYNVVKRQYKDTECGMFSMFFLIHCLEGKLTFREICEAMVKDDAVHALRSVLYRPNSSCGVK
jgi:hypothetical protein